MSREILGEIPAFAPLARIREAVGMATQFFIRNLAWTTTAKEVGELLQQGNIDVSAVLVYYDPEVGRPRGFALVETAEHYELRALASAVEVGELAGRRVVVEVPASQAFLRYANIPPVGRRWRDYWEPPAHMASPALSDEAAHAAEVLRRDPRSPAHEDYVALYLRTIEADCRHVPWINPYGSGATGLETSAVFADLEVSVAQPAIGGERRTTPSLRRLPFREYFARQEGPLLLIHGPFGSGKTMLLKALAIDLIVARPSDLNSIRTERIPIWLPLARLRDHLESYPLSDASAIWNCVRFDVDLRFGRSLGEKVFNALQARSLSGGVFLFDGLDDLPTATLRTSFVEVAARFARQLGGGARVVITGRPHVQDAFERASDVVVMSLPPLSPQRALSVLANWMSALAPSTHYEEGEVAGRLAAFTSAMSTHDNLKQMAERPLYLAALATMDAAGRSGITSPVDLYESIVGLYLSQWTAGIGEAGRRDASDQARLSDAVSGHIRSIRGALERLAFQHVAERPASWSGESDDHAFIDPVMVYGMIASVLPETAAPRSITRFLEERLGIIAAMSGGYIFPHKSIMEFLAACHILKTPDAMPKIKLLLASDPMGHREVLSFYFSMLAMEGSVSAATYLNTVLAEVEATKRQDMTVDMALAKGILSLIPDAGSPGALRLDAFVGRLRSYLSGPTDVATRVEIGDVLARIGDTRPGVAGTLGTAGGRDAYALPDFTWRLIPPGPFIAATANRSEPWANSVELGLNGRASVRAAFHISRYPVTVGQFLDFVRAGGYSDPSLWDEEGRRWLSGQWRSAWGDRSPWLATHLATVYRQQLPLKWAAQLEFPNRPVVGISWFEAVAFANWLTRRYQAVGHPLMPTNCLVRLPFELEWEVAARGTDGRQWPWGDRWEDRDANTHEVGVDRLCAVGLFSESDSPFGVSDMSGNCWDWTGSSFVAYEEGCQPADPAAEQASVTVRGGSWCHDRFSARCAFRDWNVPGDRSDTVGFRIVIASAVSHVDIGGHDG